MIVLPPSFPYGGMENPTLTFLTPTFIAGDRSLNGLIAHELAHSWSGNLVTNANWSDSWLNEGVTSYFENRIMEAVYGRARAAQEASLSWDDMQAGLRELGPTSPRTALHDPSDDMEGGSSGIVYDKGATFLRTIERTVGRARFDAWLRAYFDRHAFQPMTSARFPSSLILAIVVTALHDIPPFVEANAPTAVALALSMGTITVPFGCTTGWPPITPVLFVLGADHV